MTDRLDELLAEAVGLGFLSAHPPIGHRRHAELFVAAVGADGPVVDLGSGGGVPGLVVAASLPERTVVLVERSPRRAAFLASAVARLGLRRTIVAATAAEEAAADHAGTAAVVTARSFGPPALTAECAVPFLSPGGRVVVSEPPGGDRARWPPDGLAVLGLALTSVDAGPPAFATLTRVDDPRIALPRSVGTSQRRPVF